MVKSIAIIGLLKRAGIDPAPYAGMFETPNLKVSQLKKGHLEDVQIHIQSTLRWDCKTYRLSPAEARDLSVQVRLALDKAGYTYEQAVTEKDLHVKDLDSPIKNAYKAIPGYDVVITVKDTRGADFLKAKDIEVLKKGIADKQANIDRMERELADLPRWIAQAKADKLAYEKLLAEKEAQ